MRKSLIIHPASTCGALKEITIEVERPRAETLHLHYRLAGNVTGIRVPPPATSARRDELWRRTCVEAFIRPKDASGYFEYNFSPSREWAAYGFAAYRSAMTSLDAPAPEITTTVTESELRVDVTFQMAGAVNLADGFELGLSAVIEDMAGEVSYWALAHPEGAPDFHHGDCFALQITALD